MQTGGAIAAGSYTLTLNSGSTAFHSLDGRALDGDYNGNAGGNYVTTLTYAALPTRSSAFADFAQGPRGDTRHDAPDQCTVPAPPTAFR